MERDSTVTGIEAAVDLMRTQKQLASSDISHGIVSVVSSTIDMRA